MIIYHQKNIAAFKGNHVYYWPGKIVMRLTKTSATAPPTASKPPSGLALMGVGT